MEILAVPILFLAATVLSIYKLANKKTSLIGKIIGVLNLCWALMFVSVILIWAKDIRDIADFVNGINFKILAFVYITLSVSYVFILFRNKKIDEKL